jgi:hypothetical protein
MIEAWPALRTFQWQTTNMIRVERGIWGKLPGDPTSTRWISRSPGFQGGGAQVQVALQAGSDDGEGPVVETPMWRYVNSRYYAVWAYGSNVLDPAGPARFIEKQILEWAPLKSVPAAAAALVLLRQARSLSREQADLRPENLLSQNPADSLQIPHLELKVNAESVGEALRVGLQCWSNADEARLATFYATIRSRRKPAFLAAPFKYVPPEALATLLLPLPNEEAGRLSLAGGMPSLQPARDDGETWDVVICPVEEAHALRPEEGTAPSAGQFPLMPPAETSLAEKLKACALVRQDADLALGPLDSVVRLLDFGAGHARALNPRQICKGSRKICDLEEQALRTALGEIRRAAGTNPMDLADELADARSRHLRYKADVFEAACQQLYGMGCTPLRRKAVTAVIQAWENDGLRFSP